MRHTVPTQTKMALVDFTELEFARQALEQKLSEYKQFQIEIASIDEVAASFWQGSIASLEIALSLLPKPMTTVIFGLE